MSDLTAENKQVSKSAPKLATEFLERSEFITSSRRLFIAGALLGVCIVFLSAMLGLPHLDMALTVTLYAFAIAIPCLSVDVLLATYKFKEPEKGTFDEFTFNALLITSVVADKIGGGAAYVGIGAVVWHFTGAALVVGIATIVVLFATLSFTGIVLMVVWMWRAAKKREA